MKYFDVVTLFPDMFEALTEFGITQRARERGLYQLVAWNPRDFATNAYRSVDDRPYGGGPGMVMSAEPLARAIRAARQRQKSCGVARNRTIYLSPQGSPLDQERIGQLGQLDGLVLLAGRYEGIDERLIELEVDEEISLGDYVVSGGELPAMVLIDALVRLQPGALNDDESSRQESFVAGLLDCPHYTRPETYEGRNVPGVLLTGNHAQIRRWRLKQSLGRTWRRRPDLLQRMLLDDEQKQLLAEYQTESKETEKTGV
jgi:tRNA (guanine37-N1)-methyltransferase